MTIVGLNSPPIQATDAVVLQLIRTSLETMLHNCGIASLQNIKDYVDEHYNGSTSDQLNITLPSTDGRFRIVTAGDLGFDSDSEHRLFGHSIVGRDTILNVNGMRLRNSGCVEFTNCVFTGDLHISMTEETLSNVYLDGCLVLGKVIIEGVSSPACSLTIYKVNCLELDVRNVCVESLDISLCKIPVLHLKDASAHNVSIRGNNIQHARLARNHFKTARIDHEQFNLRMMGGKASVAYTPQHPPKGFFEPMATFSPGNTDREDIFETLAFLRRHTALESDRRALNTVRLIESSQYQNSFWAGVTVKLLGGLQRPVFILGFALGVLLLFALIYSCFPFEFKIGDGLPQPLSFPSACYFSGVTMTTVGYGDIAPLAYARGFAVIEAILGVNLWSIFVVALVRRYID